MLDYRTPIYNSIAKNWGITIDADDISKVTNENDFIIIEGDEYLSSRIHDTPKFHVYKPNIALISGISWDHVNVFPTYDIYKNQFGVFIECNSNHSFSIHWSILRNDQ